MATKIKQEKKQHIQVFTRVRPLSAQEFRSQVVVECLSTKEVSVRDKSQKKTFTFDRVFGPDSKQIDVYKTVVGPLIDEVLQGYNCTVFAYGQTGTGKTFTMVGEKSQKHATSWEEDPNCGVIPRTLSHFFNELKMRADEFTVRVSFLELYNEELCDLLAPIDSDDAKSLKLFEDSMKKGSVIVSGLEERTVHNKDDVYAILEAGNLRRQTAPTLMNAQSSRSHTIFTITVHIKVTTPEGEDLIKTGKLNLVDLAGSENIGRSGAVDLRAREAGNINQSLLTLGRVITSLVERTPHVPYRESKLTRILQDSLGGRTKTSIIATVSPALCNIEETLSTFDYAHRARNITNKPEINQKTSKRVLLKEYTEEIERLRRDLIATREKHGVYLESENYNAIMAERENLNKELVSKLQLLKVREDELVKQEEILKSLNMDLYATQNELAVTNQKLEEAKQLCEEREDMLTELSRQTDALLKTTNEAVKDAKTLHDRLDRSRRIQELNMNSTEKFKNSFSSALVGMKNRTKDFLRKGVEEVGNNNEALKNFYNSAVVIQRQLRDIASSMVNLTKNEIHSTTEVFSDQTISSQTFLTEQLTALKSTVDTHNHIALQIISNLLYYSKQAKTNWDTLLGNFESNRKTLEKQSADIQRFREKTATLTKMVIDLQTLFAEKAKQRDEELKHYKEKCEFLEREKENLRQLNEEFAHNLQKMSQEMVQRVQRERECEEVLKNVRWEQKCQEQTFFEETLENLKKEATALGEQTEEVCDKVEESAEHLMKNSLDVLTPLVTEMASTEKEWTKSLEGSIDENTKTLERNLEGLSKACELESGRLTESSQEIENRLMETIKSLKDLGAEVEESFEVQAQNFQKEVEESQARNQNVAKKITDYSEDLFSNIHDRMVEIESFFSEGIKKDERTGTTPQRKEFNYPRRIFCFSSKNRRDERLEENQNNSNGVASDDSLSEDEKSFIHHGNGPI